MELSSKKIQHQYTVFLQTHRLWKNDVVYGLQQFEIEQKREDEYLQKINSILSPVIGMENYTAQVDVTMDFTQVQETQKTYNPDLPAIRSEFLIEENQPGSGPVGIPGALSNHPPLESDISE